MTKQKKKLLGVEVSCGDKTCAVEPGTFCQFFGTAEFALSTICRLFRQDLVHEPVDGDSPIAGWALRCDDCLRAEKKAAKQ